jgi:hypothetical protein
MKYRRRGAALRRETLARRFSDGSGHRVVLVVLAIAVVLGLLLGMLYWFADPQRREAREMPPGERRELYLHVIHGVEAFCRADAAAPDRWCRAQAELLVDLPECDDPCQKIASTYRDHATR